MEEYHGEEGYALHGVAVAFGFLGDKPLLLCYSLLHEVVELWVLLLASQLNLIKGKGVTAMASTVLSGIEKISHHLQLHVSPS